MTKAIYKSPRSGKRSAPVEVGSRAARTLERGGWQLADYMSEVPAELLPIDGAHLEPVSSFEGVELPGDADIDTIGLPENITVPLHEAGFHTLHDVDAAGNQDLLVIEGIDRAALKQIRAASDTFFKDMLAKAQAVAQSQE